MMIHEFSRTELLIGREALERLKKCKVAVFGIGGVGSFAAEALARAGIGKLVLVDKDVVEITNLNRQLIATRKTLGMPKVEIMRQRILDINPDAEVIARRAFYLPETADELIQDDYDYIVDAVDTVTAKIDLVVQAKRRGIPIISSMGAGNKMDPARFRVADIYSTSVDPLAKVMRKELRSRGIDSLKVVYSDEPPITPMKSEEKSAKRQVPGSISFVPPVAGMIIAGEVVKDLIGYSGRNSSQSD